MDKFQPGDIVEITDENHGQILEKLKGRRLTISGKGGRTMGGLYFYRFEENINGDPTFGIREDCLCLVDDATQNTQAIDDDSFCALLFKVGD